MGPLLFEPITNCDRFSGTPPTLNQAVKRNAHRFLEDSISQLSGAEKFEVITNCEHLARLKLAKSLPFAFTEHGAIRLPLF